MTGAETKAVLPRRDLSDDRDVAPLPMAMSAVLAAAVIVCALGLAILYPSAQAAESDETTPMALIGP